MITTTCSTCVFNTSEDGVECYLGRYNIFKSKGEVTEDGLSIKRMCTGCRDSKWLESDLKTAKLALEKDLKNVYSLLVFDKNDGDVLGRLRVSLENRQTINPRQIVFVYSSDYPLNEITQFLINYVQGTDIRYNAIRVLEERYEREMVDIGVRSVDGMFYTILENGQKLPSTLTETLYNSIENKLLKIAIVKGDGLNGLTVLKKLHLAVGGNDGDLIENKLSILEDDSANLDMIKTWEQLCE